MISTPRIDRLRTLKLRQERLMRSVVAGQRSLPLSDLHAQMQQLDRLSELIADVERRLA
jgi:hypothetical protein